MGYKKIMSYSDIMTDLKARFSDIDEENLKKIPVIVSEHNYFIDELAALMLAKTLGDDYKWLQDIVERCRGSKSTDYLDEVQSEIKNRDLAISEILETYENI